MVLGSRRKGLLPFHVHVSSFTVWLFYIKCTCGCQIEIFLPANSGDTRSSSNPPSGTKSLLLLLSQCRMASIFSTGETSSTHGGDSSYLSTRFFHSSIMSSREYRRRIPRETVSDPLVESKAKQFMNTGQARVALGIRFSWIGDVADRLGGVVPKGLKPVADLGPLV